MAPEILTERLILKPLTLQDADAIQVVFPQWEIVRYLIDSVPWPYPDGAARDFVANGITRCRGGKRLVLDDTAQGRGDDADWGHQPEGHAGQPSRLLAGTGMAGAGLHDGGQ